MQRSLSSFFAMLAISIPVVTTNICAENADFSSTSDNCTPSLSLSETVAAPSERPFTAFTGRITKNKVRMRLQPSLDSMILRVLSRHDLVVIVGESDDFYAVQPPSDVKGYIFRTFVLENVIEGHKVNVRLEPSIESPVIAQMNSGDSVQGTISSLDKKWLEISPPTSTRFYISKEYVEKIGNANYITVLEKQKEELNQELNKLYLTSQSELQKPFNQIKLETITQNLIKISVQNIDFPEQSARAKEMLTTIQDAYLQKKVAFIEMKIEPAPIPLQAASAQLVIATKEQPINQEKESITQAVVSEQCNPTETTLPIQNKSSLWTPIEENLYKEWAGQNENHSIGEFYQDQWKNAITLTGIVESYTRPVKNKPGDFILINQSTHLPIAYLYSTTINLQEKIGQEISVRAISRDNNNFAFPAYFVLSLQ